VLEVQRTNIVDPNFQLAVIKSEFKTLANHLRPSAAADLQAKSGGVLNWWPSTGTDQFQNRFPEVFRALFSGIMSADDPRMEVPYVEVYS
jgi:hypothetical protein